MLQFRIRYMLDSKGIVNPYNFLIKNGFTPNVATRLINDKQGQLKLSQVTKLCKLLKCTPNDILKWVDTKDDHLPSDHPLFSLVRNDTPYNIINNINNLSFDQIKEVHQFINRLNASETSEIKK